MQSFHPSHVVAAALIVALLTASAFQESRLSGGRNAASHRYCEATNIIDAKTRECMEHAAMQRLEGIGSEISYRR